LTSLSTKKQNEVHERKWIHSGKVKYITKSKHTVVEVEVKLQPTVSCPVRQHQSGTRGKFLFLLEIFFRQLRVCYFEVPSLTRGWVCNLLLLLVLASEVPQDSRAYFIVPILETPPTWRAKSPYLFPPGTVPRALGSLSFASYDSQGYGGRILSRLHTGNTVVWRGKALYIAMDSL
jgi:hypothetical protein